MSQPLTDKIDAAAAEALSQADFTDIQKPLRTPATPAPMTPATRLERLRGIATNTLSEMRVLADKLTLECEKQKLTVEHEFMRAHHELDVAKQARLDGIDEEFAKAILPVDELVTLCQRALLED